MTAQDFIQRFMDAAFDQYNVRWPAPELVRYANDGQRDIALYRPDAFITSGVLTTVAGTKQALPDGATKLLRVVRNANGRSVKTVPHEVLDAIAPNWHVSVQAGTVKNVTYDERAPLEYYCFPPSDGSATIHAVWAIEPADIPTPTGNTKATCTGYLSCSDMYANALLDYVLYRAYVKDSGMQENMAKAQFRYGLYAAALGIEAKATVQFSPNANSPLAPHANP